MALLSPRKFWRQDIALDVGTATTRVAVGMHRLIENPRKQLPNVRFVAVWWSICLTAYLHYIDLSQCLQF